MAPEPSSWPPAGDKTVLPRQHNARQLHVRTRRSDLTFDNTGAEYRIGRDPSADISLDDSRVSWTHAVLRVENGTWVLEDRGSTNGTWVGVQRISRLEITSISVVRLGDSAEGPLVRFELDEVPAQQASAQAPAAPPQPPGRQPQGGYQPQQGAAYQPPPAPPLDGYQPQAGGGYTPANGGYAAQAGPQSA